jgi:GntR family transcriptional regulator, rspAB operon transcriptional repressor
MEIQSSRQPRENMRDAVVRLGDVGARPAGSTSQWLTDELRRSIVELDLPPGTWLSEQDIAQRYGVSRQPVREALISLAHANLVETRPQRGSIVCLLSIDRMREARFLRETIECAVVRAACAAFDSAAADEIEVLLAQQDIHARRGNRHEFQVADAQFHEVLARGAGLPNAWEIIEKLKLHTDRICKLTLGSPGALATLTQQHREIFAAVLARNTARAERLMTEHLAQILNQLDSIREDNATWFA